MMKRRLPPARAAQEHRADEDRPAFASATRRGAPRRPGRVWLFDLDDTLHDATHAAFAPASRAMTDYIVHHLGLDPEAAAELRWRYWRRYGATLLGLVRHHGVKAAHFLHETHLLPGLEERLRSSAHDRAALARLPGRKVVLTNAPRAYALRVLRALGLARRFDAVLTIEDMAMFGSHRPKPDARMLRHVAARLKVPPHRCTLVEDTLVHQKAARGIGMQTVWMRRYLRAGRIPGVPRAAAQSPAAEAGEAQAAEARAGEAQHATPVSPAPSHLPPGAERGLRRGAKPVYVGRRIVSLQALRGR